MVLKNMHTNYKEMIIIENEIDNQQLEDKLTDFAKAANELTTNKLINKTAGNMELAELRTDEVPLRTEKTEELENRE